MSDLAQANNEFGVALYGALRERPGNLFLSPFSVRAALGMAHAGAKRETAAQMERVLRFSLSDETQLATLAEIMRRLRPADNRLYELEIANSLWSQDGAPLLPAFLDLVARHFGGGVNSVDFGRDPEAARSAINAWVEERTRRKIRDVIPPGALNALTRLVLANAVYFKGQWVDQFPVALTRDERFYLGDGGEVQAPLMNQTAEVRYMRSVTYAAVDMDYRGCDLPMLILLPHRKDGLAELERALSPRMIHDCVERLKSREVELTLPRFKVTWGTIDLRDQLVGLGMPLVFEDSRADFSGMNGVGPGELESLFIAAVFHKAFLEVKETGTEAAAATMVDVEALSAAPHLFPSPPPPIFRADHPFLFAIRDRMSGAILFLGRVEDPTREN